MRPHLAVVSMVRSVVIPGSFSFVSDFLYEPRDRRTLYRYIYVNRTSGWVIEPAGSGGSTFEVKLSSEWAIAPPSGSNAICYHTRTLHAANSEGYQEIPKFQSITAARLVHQRSDAALCTRG